MLTVEKLRRGRLAEVVEPMFSRYLFIRLDTEHSNWAPIRSTLGVSRLVSFGNRPAPMADELIQAQLRIAALERKLEREERHVSAGYLRRAPSHRSRQIKPPLATALTDDWIATGKEAP
jgi:transcription antitermination factor NusG